MTGPVQMLMDGGPFATAVVGFGIAAVMAIAAMGIAGILRVRIPTPLWLGPGLATVVLGSVATLYGMRIGSSALSVASADTLGDIAAGALVVGHHADILALLTASLSFIAAAAAASVGVVRTERPTWSILNAVIPGLCGALGGFAIVVGALVTGSIGLAIVGVGALVVLGGAAMAVASAAGSKSRKVVERLAELRLTVAACAILALVTWTSAWRIALGISAVSDPTQHASTIAVSWAGIAGVLILVLAAIGATTPLARHAITLRTIAGAAIALALVTGAAAMRITAAIAAIPIAYDAFGGAIQDTAYLAVAAIPAAEDLAQTPGGNPVVGTCLAVDGRTGWTAGPLLWSLDPQAEIDRALPDDGEYSELDSMPGCPTANQLVDGPFSTFEVPVLAIAADRLAPAITGTEWFVQEGELRVLVATTPLGELPAKSRARAARTVTFHWERPPTDTPVAPPEDTEPGAWNHAAARAMLHSVVLLEGPVPMLVSGGARAWLEDGEVGVEQIRNAMLIARDRDLVMVPRKNWTTGDLVRFCLAIADVDGARCVIRPENTVRWSERTGLSLPW